MMALTKQYLNTDKDLLNTHGLTLRQSEQGLTLKATILAPDGSPYDLSGGKTVVFNEHKENDKYIVDNGVKITDAAHGEIEYTLHSQCYAATGEAWFEIDSSDGSVIDSTQNFNMTVLDAANASIYNSNYISKLDDLRDQMQKLVDGADGKLKDQLQKAQTDLNSKLDAMQKAYDDQAKSLQDAFDKAENDRKTADDNAEQARQTEYESDKKTRDDTYNADKQKRDSDWSTSLSDIKKAASDEQTAIQKAADKQNSDNQTAWETEKQSLIDDWNKTQQGFNDTLNGLKTTVDGLQTTVDQLNKTDLPNAQSKMDALNDEITKAEQTFSEVDFSKFVTGDQFKAVQDTLATKADKTEVDTKLADYYDKTAVDSKLADKANAADVYTKAELDPKLAEAGKVKTVSLNGGNKVAPDSGGNIDLSVPQPDLTGYAKTADVNEQFTTVTGQIKELQSRQSTFTPITQADYDALPEDKKANGMYAIIG